MNNFRQDINRTIEDLDRFKRELIFFLVSNDINPDLLSQIELSVYEVIINVIDHTTNENQQDKISFNCDLTDSEIICDIQYSGQEFDIKNADLPDIVKHFKKGKNRGLGIYIIHTLMDKVEYSYTDNINKLLIHKKI